MGVYIEITFHCPGCNSHVEVQTYGDHLQYSASDLPLDVAKQIKGETVHCKNCGEKWEVAFKTPKLECELVTPSENQSIANLVNDLKPAGTFCSTCGDPQRVGANGGLICTNMHIEAARE